MMITSWHKAIHYERNGIVRILHTDPALMSEAFCSSEVSYK